MTVQKLLQSHTTQVFFFLLKCLEVPSTSLVGAPLSLIHIQSVRSSKSKDFVSFFFSLNYNIISTFIRPSTANCLHKKSFFLLSGEVSGPMWFE